MPLPLSLLLSWMTSVALAGHRGSPLTCECSTIQCADQHTSVCTTEGLCFTQYLDRGSGSPSLVRGCTDGRTPILCENRKPSRAKNWPLLHCCHQDFCNRDAVPTAPNATVEKSSLEVVTDLSDDELPEDSTPSRWYSFQRKGNISPVFVSVLVLGIVSLVFICIVAAVVIRRSNRYYCSNQYGALEFPRVARCDCDSEVDSSQPYLHMVCPNRNT